MNKNSIEVFLSTIMLFAATLACGENEQMFVPVPPSIDEIVFAGKVVDPLNGTWSNNRLVVIFLQSEEVGRTITTTGEFNAIEQAGGQKRLDGGLGIVDGLFVLRVPNTYNLSTDNLGIPIEETQFVRSFEGQHGSLSTWVDPFYEGNILDFYIPSKNIHYTLMVLPDNVSQLPTEIQQPGSLALLEGNRLVAVNPNAPAPTPQPAFSNNLADFQQVTENVHEFPPAIFPINNCGGAADVKQEISQTYIHEIIDESKLAFGIELPIFDWLTISAEIERHYGISDREVATYSTTLIVPAGNNIQYTVIRRQTWETGIAVVTSNGVQISAPYRILKSEAFEVANSEQRACP